jgi:hypothetical protein
MGVARRVHGSPQGLVSTRGYPHYWCAAGNTTYHLFIIKTPYPSESNELTAFLILRPHRLRCNHPRLHRASVRHVLNVGRVRSSRKTLQHDRFSTTSASYILQPVRSTQRYLYLFAVINAVCHKLTVWAYGLQVLLNRHIPNRTQKSLTTDEAVSHLPPVHSMLRTA